MRRNVVVKRGTVRRKRIFVKREKKIVREKDRLIRGVIERIDRSKLIGRAK